MTAANTTKPSTRFTLYNFKGEPVAYYLVDQVAVPQPKPAKDVKHHLIIVDVSGSMAYTIVETRAMVEKVLTVQEFNDPDQLITLITYSSKSDVTAHFVRERISDVMKPGSKHVELIRQLRAKAMTCASQAFEMALQYVRDGETTAISLHTDGWFNDPSPNYEARAFDALIEKAKVKRNVFVNTIAYGYADYTVLAKISNALSGKCIKAGTVKEVYEALYDTQALLAGRMTPAIVIPKDADVDYQMSLNVSQRKVNGTTAELTVRGVKDDDSFGIYRFRKLTADGFAKKTQGLSETPNEVLYAFARSKLAEGNPNLAKLVLCSTRNQTLLEQYSKALTNDQLTAFGLALEEAMFNPPTAAYSFSEKPGLANANKPTLLDLFKLLNEYKADFTVDMNELRSGYVRKSVKKVSGTWSYEDKAAPTAEDVEKATFRPADLKLVPLDDPSMVSTGGFQANNAEATVNLLCTRPAEIQRRGVIRDSWLPVKMVAGVKLTGKLSMFNNYTIISNGDANVASLPLRGISKELFDKLVAFGALPKGKFSASALYPVNLREFPLVKFDQSFDDLPPDLVERMAFRRVLISLCSVIGKIRASGGDEDDTVVAGTKYTVEQEKELKDHFLSTKLYFSPPMRNPYTDRTAAIHKGLLDTRTKYLIDIGDKTVLSLSDLPSANEFFGRRFVTAGADGKPKKAKVNDLFDGKSQVSVKDTKRLTLTKVDDLLFPLFDAFFRSAKTGVLIDTLKDLGISAAMAKTLAAEKSDLGAVQKAAVTIEGLLTDAQELDYETYVRPLAFYIGSSGLIPEGWNVQMLDSVKLLEKFPHFGKVDEDASYLVSGETIITLSAKNSDILTEEGLKQASLLMASGAEAED